MNQQAPDWGGENPSSDREQHDPEVVGERRKMRCRRYDFCLGIAISQGWPGFHCLNCPVDDQYTEAELRQQHAPRQSSQLSTAEEKNENVGGINVNGIRKAVDRFRVKRGIKRTEVPTGSWGPGFKAGQPK